MHVDLQGADDCLLHQREPLHVSGSTLTLLLIRSQVLAAVRATLLRSLKNADLPFSKLVEALGVTRSPAYTPIFQAMLALNEGSSMPGTSSSRSSLTFSHVSPEVT